MYKTAGNVHADCRVGVQDIACVFIGRSYGLETPLFCGKVSFEYGGKLISEVIGNLKTE